MTLVDVQPWTPSQFPGMPDFEMEWAPTTVGANAPSWRSLTKVDSVRKVDIKRGRPSELNRFQAGKLGAEVGNLLGYYNTEDPSSPFYGKALPEKWVRAQMRYNGQVYDLFAGLADAWDEDYDPGTNDATVPLSVTDPLKVLAQTDIPSSMYELVVTRDKPRFWYRLADAASSPTCVDSGFAQQGANGTVQSGVTLGTTGLLNFDGGRSCATFGGLGFISLPSQVVGGALTNLQTYTIECWVQRQPHAGLAFVGAQEGLVILGGVAQGAHLWWNSNGTLEFSTPEQGFGHATIDTAATFDDGHPHHVVCVADAASTTATMYVDDVNVGSAAYPVAGLIPIFCEIGGDANSGAFGVVNTFQGEIQEVAIYWNALDRPNGVTLDTSRVSDHFHAGVDALFGEDTGSRVTRILDYIRWPTWARNISTGASTLGSYELPGGKASSYLNSLDVTEQGQFYADRAGRITWRSRHDLITDPRSNTSQATFGDNPSGGTELRLVSLSRKNDETKIFNYGRVTRSGGVEQVAFDAGSIEQNFQRDYVASGVLCETDTEALAHAQWSVLRYKDPKPRIEQLVVRPRFDPSVLVPLVLVREIGDRITIKRRGTLFGNGTLIAVDYIIEGIAHSIVQGDWTVTFTLSAAETTPYWILGDSTYGVLGTTTRLTF